MNDKTKFQIVEAIVTGIVLITAIVCVTILLYFGVI